MVSNVRSHYRTYLLTVWQEGEPQADTPRSRRFRLEDPQTGQHRLFADEHVFVEKLMEWISECENDEGKTTK